jgi:hypothetical protein
MLMNIYTLQNRAEMPEQPNNRGFLLGAATP